MRVVPPLVYGSIIYGLVGLVPTVVTFWKFMLALVLWHVYAALRRAHGDGPVAALARAVAVAVGIVLSLQLYDALVEWVIRRAL